MTLESFSRGSYYPLFVPVFQHDAKNTRSIACLLIGEAAEALHPAAAKEVADVEDAAEEQEEEEEEDGATPPDLRSGSAAADTVSHNHE